MIMDRSEYHEYLKQRNGECGLCEATNNPFLLKETTYWCWLGAIAPYWEYHSMLVPKRHVTKFSQLQEAEITEAYLLLDNIIEGLNEANLLWRDGQIIKDWIFAWRGRQSKITAEGNITIDHLHLHILPDRDHHIDPMICYDAFIPRKEEIVQNLRHVSQLF